MTYADSARAGSDKHGATAFSVVGDGPMSASEHGHG